MRVTIIEGDGVVGVDGVFRKVSLAGIDTAVKAVQFDTITGKGHVEYDEGATVEARVRDHAAEDAAHADALAAHQAAQAALTPALEALQAAQGGENAEAIASAQAALDQIVQAEKDARDSIGALRPIMTTKQVRRETTVIDAAVFAAEFQRFVDRWQIASERP